MSRRRRLIAIGDNSIPSFEWKFNPEVKHRDEGEIPGCIPPNAQFHTHQSQHAPDCEWLGYILPNASHWKPPHLRETRDQFNEKDNYRCRDVASVNIHSALLLEQKQWALAMWNAGAFVGHFAYQEFMRYFGSSDLLPKPAWDNSLTVKVCG